MVQFFNLIHSMGLRGGQITYNGVKIGNEDFVLSPIVDFCAMGVNRYPYLKKFGGPRPLGEPVFCSRGNLFEDLEHRYPHEKR